jgi:hypothetical protein
VSGARLTWVARTPNRKTGDIPSAYVGTTLEECRDTCQGCALLDRTCYAWAGLTRVSFGRIAERRKTRPGDYTLVSALKRRAHTAKTVRLGVMGDPSRVDREELLASVAVVRHVGLGVIGYSHFWREPENAELASTLLASCENTNDAGHALALGWTPAVLLPWDHEGATFQLAGDRKGLVCPAQRKVAVTCNDCRLCDLDHEVWKAGKIHAIGFLDHSRAASRERRRGRHLPMFGAVDVRPVGATA